LVEKLFLVNLKQIFGSMKNVALSVALLILILNVLSGQEQLPAEKKVAYGTDGRIFINRDLGVYVWISNSPDENSKKVRLISDSSKKYSNPMYFDTEGLNTFRSPSCVDTTTKKMVFPEQDIIFEVYPDSKPPITKAKLHAKNSWQNNSNAFYPNPLKVVLAGNDILSGVDKTFFSINGSAFSVYSDTLKFTAEGETTLKYYSSDKTGNLEKIEQLKFNIDNTAPVSTADVSLGKTIKLTAADNLSGVKTIYYQINNSSVKVYTAPLSLKLLGKDGSLTYWSVDNVNNTESKKTISSKDFKASGTIQ
jgi:hypothetical protein